MRSEMSLARWHEGDVYVFYATTGGIICICCRFMPLKEIRHEEGSPFFGLNGRMVHATYHTNSRAEMLAHLRRHREAGDSVPCRAFEELEKDIRQSGDNANDFKD